jgi:hypothetical protein
MSLQAKALSSEKWIKDLMDCNDSASGMLENNHEKIIA